MACYFDEHDCTPLANGQTPDQLVHLARLLVDTGTWNENAFSSLFSSQPPPPTAKDFISQLEDSHETLDHQCPICLRYSDKHETVFKLPCKHAFHKECIKQWMKKTSTCPVCRYELPTDDENYEEMKRQRKREEQRKKDIEALHDSMFG